MADGELAKIKRNEIPQLFGVHHNSVSLWRKQFAESFPKQDKNGLWVARDLLCWWLGMKAPKEAAIPVYERIRDRLGKDIPEVVDQQTAVDQVNLSHGQTVNGAARRSAA